MPPHAYTLTPVPSSAHVMPGMLLLPSQKLLIQNVTENDSTGVLRMA